MNREVMTSAIQQGSLLGDTRQALCSRHSTRHLPERAKLLLRPILNLCKPARPRHLHPTSDQTLIRVEDSRHTAWALVGGTAIDNLLKHA